MNEIDEMTHLVHIWYDEWEHLDFETRVISHLQEISDKAFHVVNFVDETLYTIEDMKVVEKNLLAQALADFLHICDLKSTNLARDLNFGKNLQNIPWKVLDFLRKELDGQWQAMEKPTVLFNEWSRNSRLDSDLPAHIRTEIDEHDAIKIKIFWERFNDILWKMLQEFQWKNIFWIEVWEDIRNDNVSNIERKLSITESARALLWEERIIFSGMRDGDMHKVMLANKWEEDDVEFEKMIKDSNIDYKEWETPYGNATKMLTQENRNLAMERAERYFKAFFAAVQEKGFCVSRSHTLHNLWGEYFERCVHSYGVTLMLYWMEEGNIQPKAQISLKKP